MNRIAKSTGLIALGAVLACAAGLARSEQPMQNATNSQEGIRENSIGFTGGFLYRVAVTDRKNSMRWYRDILGFDLLFEVDEIGWCEMVQRDAKVTIGLLQADEVAAGNSVVPIFGVRDLEAARSCLAAKGVQFTGPIEVHEGLVKLSTLTDPDGHRITLYQSLASGPSAEDSTTKP